MTRGLLLCYLLGCAPHSRYPGAPRSVYHADVRLNAEQRKIVRSVVADWNVHLSGARHLSVIFDWRRDKNQEPRIEAGEPSDARAPGVPMAPDGEEVAGFCTGARIVWINRTYEVLSHEVGHSVGILTHDKREGRVMSETTKAGQTWQREDQDYCVYVGVCPAN